MWQMRQDPQREVPKQKRSKEYGWTLIHCNTQQSASNGALLPTWDI
jgi:hypothetical protein